MSVSERLVIWFAEPDSRRAAIAIAGAGALVAGGGVVREGSAGVEQREGGGVTTTVDGSSVVTLDPLGTPSMLADGTRIWLCGAHGMLDGAPFDGIGTITHGVPHRDAPLERSVTLVLDPQLAVAIGARRPRAPAAMVTK